MPDKDGNIKGISVPRVPWHEQRIETSPGFNLTSDDWNEMLAQGLAEVVTATQRTVVDNEEGDPIIKWTLVCPVCGGATGCGCPE